MCMSTPGVFFVKSAASGEADSYTVLALEDSKMLSGNGKQQLQSSAKWICSSLLGANGTNKIAIVKYSRTNTSIPFTDSYNTQFHKEAGNCLFKKMNLQYGVFY